MKIFKISGIFFLVALFTMLNACEDDTTTIGSSISKGEVEITVDTLYFDLKAAPLKISSFDSKTGNLMVGSIDVEKYGRLDCSFVTRLMCAANLEVPDSLLLPERVDSVKLILGAQRDEIVGDSLAPQRLTIYKLTKQLPSDIDNNFNPEGYFNPQQPFASKSYTVSEIASKDSLFYNSSYVDLSVDLPVEFGREIFETYIQHPEYFQWPKTMAENFLPGLYVKPSFGHGCVANIQTVYVSVFYYSLAEVTETDEDDESVTIVKHVNNMAVPFTVSPEVLSSNNISYIPSQEINDWNENPDGKIVITTPGGYIANYEFPAQTLIDKYQEKNIHLSTVNDLNIYIPATPFDSESGISVAQSLLMVKTSEYESFFKDNKIPDSLTSFVGVYDAENERYYFSTMRNYFIDLLSKKSISKEDVEFTLVPVEIVTETVPSYYGEASTYVTKCVPYTAKPTMTLLDTGNAMVTFSFSTQVID